MGTNYYFFKRENVCEKCGRADEVELHIGKSSAGWCFGLHVIPEEGINDLEDWKKYWEKPNTEIRDEYNKVVRPEEMLKIITKRKRDSPRACPPGYRDYNSFLERNYAEPGPNNLLRHKVDPRFCVGHGEGTWDLMVGSFS